MKRKGINQYIDYILEYILKNRSMQLFLILFLLFFWPLIVKFIIENISTASDDGIGVFGDSFGGLTSILTFITFLYLIKSNQENKRYTELSINLQKLENYKSIHASIFDMEIYKTILRSTESLEIQFIYYTDSTGKFQEIFTKDRNVIKKFIDSNRNLNMDIFDEIYGFNANNTRRTEILLKENVNELLFKIDSILYCLQSELIDYNVNFQFFDSVFKILKYGPIREYIIRNREDLNYIHIISYYDKGIKNIPWTNNGTP
ncbi:hypothetical protein [Deinococcus misasensis]|uniref:hypothetical protein n=1 Tax=Deinococcus misasensis TaxID=392413 RepID=UPI000554DD13|nr:hypothetical protein [Deinococcus misasensis]